MIEVKYITSWNELRSKEFYSEYKLKIFLNKLKHVKGVKIISITNWR